MKKQACSAMRLLLYALLLVGGVQHSSAIASSPDLDTEVFCEGSSPVTLYVRTLRTGGVAFMQFRSSYFDEFEDLLGRQFGAGSPSVSTYTPEHRCNLVADRFQTYYGECPEALNIENITTATWRDVVHGENIYYPVILTTYPVRAQGCMLEEDRGFDIPGLLFMLPPTANPASLSEAAEKALVALQQLSDLRRYGTSNNNNTSSASIIQN
jgi:hypothetical protein